MDTISRLTKRKKNSVRKPGRHLGDATAMTTEGDSTTDRKGFFRGLFRPSYHDELEKELNRLEIIRRATRRKFVLKKKTITRTDASVTVVNPNSTHRRITMRASIRQADLYASDTLYDPDEISTRLRNLLPAVVDDEELNKPIGDLADKMSGSDMRFIMERAREREAVTNTARNEQLRSRLKSRVEYREAESERNYKTSLGHGSRLRGDQSRTRSVAKAKGPSLSNAPLVLAPERHSAMAVNRVGRQTPVITVRPDDISPLEHYQQRGIINDTQAQKFLEQQRKRLDKARKQSQLDAQNFVTDAGSTTSGSLKKPFRRFDEHQLDLINKGKDYALFPKEEIRAMRARIASNAASASSIATRSTPPQAPTNAFFRNRDKSAFVAKFSAVSLELELSGDAAKNVVDSQVIGESTRQSVTYSTTTTTETEDTIIIDPDDPLPKWQKRPSYRYQALESDQHLRLLSVLPFVESGRFMYEMQTFGLDQAPPFESVSYVWGDDKRNYDLAFSDSSVLKITQSLFVALSILSQHCRTGHLWIDQLCIDQSNVQERNHQVKSMGSIYKQAEKVLVFLDPSPRVIQPEGLFTLLDFVETSIPRISAPDPFWNIRHALEGVIQPHYDEKSDYARVWRDIVRLFQHPWFTRAWIFQEFVLSDIVLFAMGHRLAPLDALLQIALAAASFERDRLLEFRHNECLTRSPGFNQLQLMSDVRRQRIKDDGINSEAFWAMLSQVAPNCQSKDDRDRLYAFLGLLQDSRIDIRPDYRTSVVDVFVDAASVAIAGQESLSMLAFVDRAIGAGPMKSTLPSWVPDWRRAQTVKLFNQDAFTAALRRKHTAKPQMTNVPHMKYGLRASGQIVDHVVYVSPSHFYSSKPWDSRDICSFLNLEEHVDRLIRKFGRALGKPTQIQERLLRTIIVDGAESAVSSNATGYTPVHPAKIKRFLQTYHRYGRFASLQSRSGESVGSVPPIPPPSQALLRQLRHMSRIAFGRRIFVTKSGKLGLGPEAVTVGNDVCVLHGSPLPIVMRRHAKVVGQCYVEGFMRGEAVDWSAEDADEFLIL